MNECHDDESSSFNVKRLLPSISSPTFERQHQTTTNNSAQIMSRFNPYEENGGSILAIAGQDFSVIAGDTRYVLCFLSTPGVTSLNVHDMLTTASCFVFQAIVKL